MPASSLEASLGADLATSIRISRAAPAALWCPPTQCDILVRKVGVVARVITFALALSIGCGPTISPSVDDGTDAATGGSTSTWDENSLTAEAAEAGSSSESSESSGAEACEPLPAVAPVPEATWCTGDPYALPPYASRYVSCVRGFVEFEQSSTSDGYLFYSAIAQFYDVLADATGGLFGAALDPYDGSLDDCALYDGSNEGDESAIAFEDAGDVTFTFEDVELTAQTSVGPGFISYSVDAAESEVAPRFLARRAGTRAVLPHARRRRVHGATRARVSSSARGRVAHPPPRRHTPRRRGRRSQHRRHGRDPELGAGDAAVRYRLAI